MNIRKGLLHSGAGTFEHTEVSAFLKRRHADAVQVHDQFLARLHSTSGNSGSPTQMEIKEARDSSPRLLQNIGSLLAGIGFKKAMQ